MKPVLHRLVDEEPDALHHASAVFGSGFSRMSPKYVTSAPVEPRIPNHPRLFSQILVGKFPITRYSILP
jgi:hypothetical protein